jgi:hypothetical protein
MGKNKSRKTEELKTIFSPHFTVVYGGGGVIHQAGKDTLALTALDAFLPVKIILTANIEKSRKSLKSFCQVQ